MKNTLPSNSEQIMAPTTFHQFALLPVEIQTEIWKLAARSATDESRVIPIVVHWTPGCSSQRYDGMKNKTPLFLTPISVIPPLLHVCSISRSLALPIYELVSMSNKCGHQDKINAMGVRLSAPSTHGDEATGIYINLKKDIVYFTNHDIFDKTGNQHFPMSNTHADLEDRLTYEPQFCQPCSDLLFPVNDALRLLFGDMDVRKELRNIGFSFDIPVKRHHFCWGGMSEDFYGIRRIVFVSEAKGEKRSLRNGKVHGTHAAASTSKILKFTTPSPYIRDKCFETYKDRFHIQGDHMRDGWDYMMINAREQFFQPLINGFTGPRMTGPGPGRNWLQWGVHGLVPFGWKGTGVGEEWEEDGGDEWNHEHIGPRVEFLVEDGKDSNRAMRDIFLV
ncbi:uncharacterized protein EAE98_000655 [Botrytis deweyae]|uniref:2EXR domain-containing protein n=1 Tax=Botrytis deweyae TaxID=2478750 RepID=A0ABQ7J3C5_9HELO|nr:uncharacterized protein EAE98_000655 [Botrytis deweyae]KAF7940528.1 hypothetical protein EAE98_000655 [Botrytis deweyae]